VSSVSSVTTVTTVWLMGVSRIGPMAGRMAKSMSLRGCSQQVWPRQPHAVSLAPAAILSSSHS
jgi:hypothetical protein